MVAKWFKLFAVLSDDHSPTTDRYTWRFIIIKILVSSDPIFSSNIPEYQACMWYTDMHAKLIIYAHEIRYK